jgi:hypothetical protein
MLLALLTLHDYRLIAGGWFLLLLILGIFWFLMLSRLSDIIRAQLKANGSRDPGPTLSGMVPYIFRGDFRSAADPRIINVCKKLRKLLCAYFGAIGAYIVFLVIMRPPV